MAAAFDSLDTLSQYESAFVNAVLAFHGIREVPSIEEFTAALTVLQRYAQQVQDNPRDDSRSSWAQRMEVADVAAIDARAFLLFGSTKPTPDQWRRVHREIYGPLLCEDCE
jgi:hypothetical protein